MAKSDEEDGSGTLYGNALLHQEPDDGSDVLQAVPEVALRGKSANARESDDALYEKALLQCAPLDGADELQAVFGEARHGKSDEGESDSVLVGNAMLQHKPDDSSVGSQADSLRSTKSNRNPVVVTRFCLSSSQSERFVLFFFAGVDFPAMSTQSGRVRRWADNVPVICSYI